MAARGQIKPAAAIPESQVSSPNVSLSDLFHSGSQITYLAYSFLGLALDALRDVGAL